MLGTLATRFDPYFVAFAYVGACAIAFVTRARLVSIVALLAFACGVVDASLRHAPTPVGDSRIVRYDARVLDERVVSPDAVAATLRFTDGSLGTATLRTAPLAVGTELVLRGKREPFDLARNPGEPVPREIEAERGLTWHLAHARIVATGRPDERDASFWIARARAWASERVHARLGEPDATILTGILWGERGSLAPALRDEFQDTGTVHVLVTAGLHLGVVAAMAYGLFALLGCGRATASLATIGVAWGYAFASGSHLPSMRAATMLSFALLARATGRASYSWNALAAAAIVVAALRPDSVGSLSFDLSFSCVAAIFAFATPLAELAERIGIPDWLRAPFGVALATQLGTWPLTAYAFLVIAPYAPLANAVVIPLVGVAMLGGFALLAATPLPWLAALVANVERTVLDAMLGVVAWVGGLPFAHIVATPPPIWTIVAYDVALVLAAIALRRERMRIAAIAIACASALCLWPPRATDRTLRITAIDVGQADALLVQTPNGHTFLVDGGGRLERGGAAGSPSTAEDVGTRTVVPFLIRSGIHRLDEILLSHPHGDHVGGFAPVLRTLTVSGFADGGRRYPGRAYRDALDVARERGVPMLEPRTGSIWRTDDGVTFRFYGPSVPYLAGTRNDINENSIVFRLEYGDFRMLFTGDAGAATEARLLASGVDLHANVLKVGHHGSAYGTSEAFVRAVAPRDAIVSVGRDNLFGHPSPTTIATLERAHVRVYRTDRDGAIAVRATERDYRVTPFLTTDATPLRPISP